MFVYRYCGPGTKLNKRLKRGDPGINNLDNYCKEHDIAYSKSNSLDDRHKADEILENRAWEVFKGNNSGLKEKAAAWAVTNAMKIKRKMGSGCGFKAAVARARKVMKNNSNEKNITKLAKKCLAASKKSMPKKNKNRPRVIKIPQKGGILPIMPIFAGLSALGALTGGVSSLVKTIKDFKRNTPVHLGKGLYLTPYKGSSYKLTKIQRSKN